MKKIFTPNSGPDLLGPPPKITPEMAHVIGKVAEIDSQMADLVMPSVMPSVHRVVEEAEKQQVETKTKVPLATNRPQLEI